MDPHFFPSKSLRWMWIAAIWFCLGLFDALQTVFVMRSERMHHAWLILFGTVMFSWLPWALGTPLILLLGRKFPPVKPIRTPVWLLHFSACAAMGLAFSAWTSWLDVLFNPYLDPAPSPYLQLWFDKFYNGLLSYVVLYAAILTVNYVLDSQRRIALQETETARLNEQLVKAQLHALRQQIEPHFLFNTLNSVAGLVREGRNESAVSMIAGLSDLLRRMPKTRMARGWQAATIRSTANATTASVSVGESSATNLIKRNANLPASKPQVWSAPRGEGDAALGAVPGIAHEFLKQRLSPMRRRSAKR